MLIRKRILLLLTVLTIRYQVEMVQVVFKIKRGFSEQASLQVKLHNTKSSFQTLT